MITATRKQPYLPDADTIRRLATEIHDENLEREYDEEDEASRIDRRGGPRLLLLSIVKHAVSSLEEWCRRYNNFHSRPYEFTALRSQAQTAYRYLMSDARDTITCFRAVCDETGADAEAVRERIFSQLDEPALRALFPRGA